MNPYRRWLVFTSFILSCIALGLASAAFATQYWVSGTGEYKAGPVTALPEAAFGLFSGYSINGIITDRDEFKVKDAYDECEEFMKMGLWVCTILFLALGMTFGIVAVVFAIINAIMTPVEAITGLFGLYIWNGIAFASTLLCLIMWTTLFYVSFSGKVVLNLARNQCGEVCDGSEDTHVGYSFWFAFAATMLYLCNIPVVYAAGRNWLKKDVHVLEEQPTDGLIMLY